MDQLISLGLFAVLVVIEYFKPGTFTSK